MTECAICLDALEKGVVTLDCCKQNIHLECLFKSLRTKSSCPYCRTDYNVPDIEAAVPVIVKNDTCKKITFSLIVAITAGFLVYRIYAST
jgi:ferritin-like protein